MAMTTWMMEDVFAPLDKSQRAFLWSIFYLKDWAGEMDLKESAHIKEVAKVLGKAGTFADMEAETIDWAEDEENNAEFKPKIKETEPGSAD